jgi:membrane fusion protein (multidrug efflux system)
MNARWNEPGLARIARFGYVATLTAIIGACKAAPPPTPPPPEVRVVSVAAQPIANIIEVPGRLQAVRTAEVRARVDGIVQRRLYAEGTDVTEGQPLFAIDPRELRARLSSAEATLARAEATAANAKQDVTRYQGLVAQQALSQQEFDAAVARQRTADADVAQARAQVEAARLSLNYTTVTAPIAGRAGRAQVTEGALVSAGSATLLTKIEQLDPIYANFAQSSSEMLALRRRSAAGGNGAQPLSGVPVRLVLEDGSVYPLVGHLNFLDLSVDEATGTTALRAEFRNPSRALLPGQFVRARIEAGTEAEGMQIPQRAVTVTPQGASVMVVSPKNVVEARTVKVGPLNGDSWVIESGLAVGERVIVDGLQQVQPGKVVTVVTTPPKAVPNAAGDAPVATPGR